MMLLAPPRGTPSSTVTTMMLLASPRGTPSSMVGNSHFFAGAATWPVRLKPNIRCVIVLLLRCWSPARWARPALKITSDAEPI